MRLTPQEILSKKFDKGMSGYKVEDVNAFLVQISDYVAELMEEKTALEDKLEILAEKVEEYRADEDSLRAALIGAQKLGDSVVRESKKKAEAVLAEARLKAQEMLADSKTSLEDEAAALQQIQEEVTRFRSHILSMYEKQMDIIRSIPYVPGAEEEDDEELPVVNPAQAPYRPVSPQQSPYAPEEDADLEGEDEGLYDVSFEEIETDPGLDEDDENYPPPRQSRFGPLQFGEDYSLTREE